jgi:hypothetical protein
MTDAPPDPIETIAAFQAGLSNLQGDALRVLRALLDQVPENKLAEMA